jgi:catalase
MSVSVREMALEFRLPDGSLQHMAMLNTPVFVAAQPLTFNEMIKAVKPDPTTGEPDQGRLREFLNSHPDAFAQWNFLAAAGPSPSYANSPYFSVHTFRFIAADGRTHFVRWRFIPHDGTKWITPSQAVWTDGSRMEDRLIERLRRGPLRWDMMVYVGEPDDTTDNASIAWPESRRHFKPGTLTIARATPEPAAHCQKASFDPLIVADGIAPADDPILLFRSPTYAVGFVRQLSLALQRGRLAAGR